MGYSKYLKAVFQGLSLSVEDLFFLEPFQIKYLPDRVPKEEFAVLLHANPIIHRYFVSMYPPIGSFITNLLKKQTPVKNNKTVDENCQDLLWEIADLIIYNKYPEVYDEKVKFEWNFSEIISANSLAGKIVIDAGAGTGKLAFLAAQFADTVFAVEPVRSFRQFIKEKTIRENVKNLFVVDGFLESIPFPDNSIDVLMTSNAIGWNLQAELMEIERVLKPNGWAIHLLQNPDADVNADTENEIHDFLISSEWKYTCTKYQVPKGWKRKYNKTMSI